MMRLFFTVHEGLTRFLGRRLIFVESQDYPQREVGLGEVVIVIDYLANDFPVLQTLRDYLDCLLLKADREATFFVPHPHLMFTRGSLRRSTAYEAVRYSNTLTKPKEVSLYITGDPVFG